MRAVGITEYGGADRLQLMEVPAPSPGPGEELIDVLLSGVNFADVSRRRGTYDATSDLPVVLGAEVVGRARADGRRVAALTGGFGGYAETAVAPTDLVFDIPDDVADEQAAAVLMQGLTAAAVINDAGQLDAGGTVAIHGAAGGVGSLAIQFARRVGAGRIVAVASSTEKRAQALRTGADRAIAADPDGLSARLLDANDGRGYDLIAEMVGGRMFDESVVALAPTGRLVSYGRAGGQPPALSRSDVTVVDFSLLDLLRTDPGALQAPARRLFEAIEAGALEPVLGRIYDASDAASAHRALEDRTSIGKLLLRWA